MVTEQPIRDRYFELLKNHVTSPAEEHLAAIAELGRLLVQIDVPPEDITEIHEEAVLRLAREFPQMTLLEIAQPISAAMMEMFMAYGLAFRARNEQLQREIAERKRVEEELRKYHEHLEELVEKRTAELAVAKERAEESDRLKSAFLSTMSHELRTPLNSIIGFTGIMLMGIVGELTAEQRKQLIMVKNSANHLLSLINDILDISKIEAGQVEIVTEQFDMREVVEKVVKTVTPLAEEKELALVAEVTPEVGEITSDRRRVEQILLNLINNAVKFTEKGEVRLECQVNDDYLVTHVIDTGIGIKPEDMDKLFEAFQQVDTGLTRRHEGTGLGLSICKKLVEMLGGEIWAESEWGVGSTFTFTLPLKR